MKKIILIIITLAILGVAWFLVSPLFINKTVNEDAPIVSTFSPEEAREIVAVNIPTESDNQIQENVFIEREIQTEQSIVVFDNSNQIPTESTNTNTNTNTNTEISEDNNQQPDDVIVGNDTQVDEPMVEMEPQASIQTLGSFSPGSSRYQGQGSVKLIQDGNTQTLRFEDFSVSNGPDLFVTLNKGNSANGEHIIVGALKGNRGNQNYDISQYDISQYDSVSIYCRAFSAEFATAQL